MFGQTLSSERSELERADRADAREASESSRKRGAVYLKLGTKQTKNHTYDRPRTTHTITDDKLYMGLGTADRVAREEGGGGVQGVSQMATTIDK